MVNNVRKNNLLVSVIMITYCHELYIKQAIEGALMQECNFDVEIIVADDCSIDKTSQIIQEIIKTHPCSFRIKYFRHEKNIGMMPNFIFALKQCTGKYIALCDGDDYWTDPLKLQKQVDFLEANPEFVLHGHGVKVVDHANNFLYNFCIPGKFSQKDLTINYPISTLSAVFRKSSLPEIPTWFSTVYNGDYALWNIVLSNEYGYISPEIMGVHIVHNEGAWAKKNSVFQAKCFFETTDILLKSDFLKPETINAILEKRKKLKRDFNTYEDLSIKKLLLGKINLLAYLFYIKEKTKILLKIY